MAQDLRKIIRQQDDDLGVQLRKDHQSRFETRLDKALPVDTVAEGSKSSGMRMWIQIAAVLIVVLGAIWYVNRQEPDTSGDIVDTDLATEEEAKQWLLSDISPDFKKVEDYYTGNIKLELARLDVTDDNKELIDAFMQQLEKLDAEYERLNDEIVEGGINEEAVSAMIDNLKLRLELLFKLKSKLKELKAAPETQTV